MPNWPITWITRRLIHGVALMHSSADPFTGLRTAHGQRIAQSFEDWLKAMRPPPLFSFSFRSPFQRALRADEEARWNALESRRHKLIPRRRPGDSGKLVWGFRDTGHQMAGL